MTDATGRSSASIVMPCFNEEATIEEAARRVLESPYTRELVIVDDGSTDRTLDIAKSLLDPRVQVLDQPRNMGKGAALRRGFAETSAPFIVIQDADLEYNPDDFEQLLAPLLGGDADVVYGSRFITGRPHRVLYYWHSVANRFLTTLSNMTTNLNLTDMETGYKAFRREVLDTLELQEDRFGFEPEFTAKVAGHNWRVYEVGVSYSGRTYDEGKKIGWRDGLWSLWCVLRYSRAGRRRPPACSLAPATLSGPERIGDTSTSEGAEAVSANSDQGCPFQRRSRHELTRPE